MTTPTPTCGRLVTVSTSPPEMTECGLPPEHDGECIPYTNLKSKRQVTYNPDAVLCPACKKRIRLNNNGKLRVHIAGKVGSDHCMGSSAEPLATTTFTSADNQATETKQPVPDSFFQKDDDDKLFSDPQQ